MSFVCAKTVGLVYAPFNNNDEASNSLFKNQLLLTTLEVPSPISLENVRRGGFRG